MFGTLAKITVVGALAASALIVAPAAQATTSAVSASVPASVPSYDYTAKENRFVKSVRSDAPSMYAMSKYQTVKLGRMTCKTLKAGATGMEIIGIYVDSGFDDEETISMIANSVVFFCPGQAYKFD